MDQAPYMSGKVCLVTGATSGIGKATALGLAKLGTTVIVVARDPAKGAATLSEITAATRNPNVAWLLANLSSQAAIRQLVAEFKRQHANPHVLINNAAVNLWSRTTTVDGIETNFAVTHLAPGGMTPADLIATCRALADVGIQHFIFSLPNVHELAPLEVIGRQVIPAVAAC